MHPLVDVYAAFDHDRTSLCLACQDDPQQTPEGLCTDCQNELRFIVRPEAHREAHRRRTAAETGLHGQLERLGVVVISSVPADNSLWICDFCNHQIPVTNHTTLIPLLGSYALCNNCVTNIPYWPQAWTNPTPRACRCGACQTLVLQAQQRLHRLQQERQGRERGYGIGL